MDKELKDLKSIYEDVYSKGKESFFSFNTLDITQIIIDEVDWNGRTVCEIGCGTGDTAYAIAKQNAQYVTAYDYSSEAIKIAKEKDYHNLEFQVGTISDISRNYDVLVMQEVLEHTENPFKVLNNLKSHLNPSGDIIITCPSFLNIRGYVWMTLQILFNVPMSLTDIHFISPFDMEKWAKSLSLEIKWRTFRYEQAFGEDMIKDMDKRLKNALRDANMDNKNVNKLLKWLKEASKYETQTQSNGAKGLYHFTNL